MKYMYHLTTEESWEHIREEGLRPRCGRNSYLCCEDRNLVYVCDGESLPYWAALLDANVLLRVPEDGLRTSSSRSTAGTRNFSPQRRWNLRCWSGSP